MDVCKNFLLHLYGDSVSLEKAQYYFSVFKCLCFVDFFRHRTAKQSIEISNRLQTRSRVRDSKGTKKTREGTTSPIGYAHPTPISGGVHEVVEDSTNRRIGPICASEVTTVWRYRNSIIIIIIIIIIIYPRYQGSRGV